MEKLLIFIPLFVMCFSCNNKKTGLTENVWDYSTSGKKQDCKGCSKQINKDFRFYIKHQDNLDISNFLIIISMKGTAYVGEYDYPILIKNLCWCSEPSMNASGISISLVDVKSNRQYVYGQKNSFDLTKKSDIYIKLLNDSKKEKGEFKIKFDDDLFYYPWFL